jgi:stearoyl-CoA desaturase (delta-9 desaturase)
MFEADSALAVRVLLKTLSMLALGFIFTFNMPLAFAPVGVFLIGIGMSLLYLIGYECSQLAFFKSKLANSITRELTWIPILKAMDGDSFGYWAIRIIPVLFAGALGFILGFERFMWGLLKYWILPLCVMNMNVHALLSKKDKAALLLFPELTEDYDALCDLLRKVPSYKIDKAFEKLNVFPSISYSAQNAAAAAGFISVPDIISMLADSICSMFPTQYFMRELLYWRKRDILLEIVLVITVALVPLHYWDIVPVQAFYFPFALFLAGFSTRAKATSYLNGYSFLFGFRHAKDTIVQFFNSLRAFSKQLNWFNIIYIGGVHVWAFIGLFTAVPVAQWKTLGFALFLHVAYGLGITAGAHRLWSHKSYSASLPVRVLLMFLNSGANQGSIWHWSRDHRVHHKYSDTEKDPHNSHYGMFFSHCGWLFLKKNQSVIDAGRNVDLSDLDQDPVVAFQKKYYPFMGILMCFVVPTIIPYYCWNEDFFVALTMSYVKYAVVLNATWTVNSLAHFFGMRPYRPDSPTSENLFVAIVAIGEGWHNYHHAYPWDYATSEYGITTQFNPTKLFIDTCAFFGLVTNRKRADHLGREARKRNALLLASKSS